MVPRQLSLHRTDLGGPTYLSLGRQRLVNLVAVERATLWLFFVALTVPLVLRRAVHIYTFDPLLLTLLMLWFIRSRRQSTAQRSGPTLNLIDLLVALLLFWTLVSVLFSVAPGVSLITWLLLLRGVAIYAYLRANFGTIIQFPDLHRIAITLLVIECSIALMQFATNSRVGSVNDMFGDVAQYAHAYFRTPFGEVIRVVGTFHNPNVLANCILIFLTLLVVELLVGLPLRRAWIYLLSLVALFTLLLTFSRSAWATAIVIGATLVMRSMFSSRRMLRTYVQKSAAVLALLFLGAMLLLLLGDQLSQNLSIDLLRARMADISGGNDWRLAYVDLSRQLYERFPLTGTGVGAFSSAVVQSYADLTIPPELYGAAEFSTVHNVYIAFFVEAGPAAGLIWLLLALTATVQAWMLYNRRYVVSEPYYATTALWLLGAWVGIAFNSNFEAVFYHQSIHILIFSLLGLIVATREQARMLRLHYQGAFRQITRQQS